MTTTPYDALIRSASLLVDTDLVDEGDASACSAFLERNRSSLLAARDALRQRCAVPLRYEESFIAEHSDDYLHLRNLARAFRMEAMQAASCENFDAAARTCVDGLELANAARRGGLVTELLLSIAFAGIAIEPLRKIRTKLGDATRHWLIDELQRLETEREPFADVVQRDRDWEAAVGYPEEKCDFISQELEDPDECGLSEEEQQELRQLLQQMADLPESDRRKIELDQDHYILALMRLLTLDFAIRSLAESSGSIPDSLSAISPGLLPCLPMDPFTNGPFIYRRIDETSFVLYSTGPKMFDGGGEFAAWPSVAAGCADLCLDVNDY